MKLPPSTATTTAVTWTDTATGTSHTTEVTVANGARVEDTGGVIAAATFDGPPDPNRVHITAVQTKPQSRNR